MTRREFFDGDEARERELGLQTVARLHAMLRAGRLYDRNNRSFQQQLREFLDTLAQARGEEITLVNMGDYFYLNGVRLKAQPAQLGLFRALREEFESRELGALRFLPGISEEEVIVFLAAFNAARTAEQADRLPEAIVEAGAQRIVAVRARDIRSIMPETAEAAAAEASGERARASENFWRAVRGTKTLLARTAKTGRPALRQARRLVQPIVDGIIREEYSIVGLTALKEHDEYTFVHCVNVSVLAIAVGHALDLPRSALASLGVAGLLHDLGKLAIAPEVLHKPGKLDPEEWAQIVRHPLEGARMIASLPGLSTLTLDAMEVSLQHHMNVDGTGYPERPPGRRLGVLPRIVAAVDVFDAMTAHRAYRKRPLTGYEALSIVVGPERAHVDPAVLWALVRSVGPYPAGTVLLTVSGRRMLSVSPNPQDPWRPLSRELAAPGHGDGAHVSLVVEEPLALDEPVERVIPPEEHGVNVEDLLAA